LTNDRRAAIGIPRQEVSLMQAFFFICFGVGVGYITLAFIIGEALSSFDFDGDTGFDGKVSPFKLSVLAAFLTVFGGTGLILNNRMLTFLALLCAVIFGFIAAFIIYRFILVPLYKAQSTSAAEKQSFIGCIATVSEYIPQEKYGKITYRMNGNTYTAPAKSEDGAEIKRNEEVVIVHIEKNTYLVRRFSLEH